MYSAHSYQIVFSWVYLVSISYSKGRFAYPLALFKEHHKALAFPGFTTGLDSLYKSTLYLIKVIKEVMIISL